MQISAAIDEGVSSFLTAPPPFTQLEKGIVHTCIDLFLTSAQWLNWFIVIWWDLHVELWVICIAKVTLFRVIIWLNKNQLCVITLLQYKIYSFRGLLPVSTRDRINIELCLVPLHSYNLLIKYQWGAVWPQTPAPISRQILKDPSYNLRISFTWKTNPISRQSLAQTAGLALTQCSFYWKDVQWLCGRSTLGQIWKSKLHCPVGIDWLDHGFNNFFSWNYVCIPFVQPK